MARKFWCASRPTWIRGARLNRWRGGLSLIAARRWRPWAWGWRPPKQSPPSSWPGGSQVIGFDGRILAQASPGPGERIVVAPVDITALRHERATRQGHHMLAHLRTEAYPVYARHRYPPVGVSPAAASYER